MESSLSITKDELAQAVGVFCGYGRGALGGEIVWTSRQQNRIDEILASGLRQFYHPPPVDQNQTRHAWSFLRPVATLTLAAGESLVDLPDDFGGASEAVTFAGSAETTFRIRLPLTNDGRVRNAFASAAAAASGPPQLVAITPKKGTSIDRGQRFQLYFYPAADQAYVFELNYSILANRLTTANPYVYGGAEHSETVKESCLAMAEQAIYDTRGEHTAKFEQLLRGSIDGDKKMRATSLGYNGDRSDERDRIYGRFGRHRDDGDLVTFQTS